MTTILAQYARVAAAVAGFGLVAMSFAPLAGAQTTTTTTTTTTATFSRDLTLGSTGADVTALQNWLISKGYSIPAGATGYFGAQTKAALAAYQATNRIAPAAGYFGPLTRSMFLKPTTPPQQPPQNNNNGNSSNSDDEEDASDAISELEDDIDNLRDEIDEAYDDGDDVDEAEDLLDEAENLLADAEDAYDDEDYDDAIDIVNDAQDVIDEALDEIGQDRDDDDDNDSDKEDAQDAIDEAWDDLDQAREDVEDSDEDEEEIDDAEDLLDEAESAILDAEDAYDDEDYDEAQDYTDEAQDLIDEALDEIGANNDEDDEDYQVTHSAKVINLEGSDNDQAEFRIEFSLGAFGDDVFIPRDVDDAIEFEIRDGGNNVISSFTTLSTNLDSTADTQGSYYVIEENDRETLTFDVTLDPLAGDEGKYFSLQLIGVNFAHSATSPNREWTARPEGEFDTRSVYIGD